MACIHGDERLRLELQGLEIVHKDAEAELAKVKAVAAQLLAACKAALDPDPCRLDHHGSCQAHGLRNPCEQKLLRDAIAAAEGLQRRLLAPAAWPSHARLLGAGSDSGEGLGVSQA